MSVLIMGKTFKILFLALKPVNLEKFRHWPILKLQVFKQFFSHIYINLIKNLNRFDAFHTNNPKT